MARRTVSGVVRRIGGVRWALLVAVALALAAMPGSARADDQEDCTSEDNDRRIAGCTGVLATPGLSPDMAALAYAMRALAYSIKGQYDEALGDYDRAIALNPDFAAALNNRAWALYKAGRATAGIADVERSLELQPGSPHALDTRAHIRQSLGKIDEAISDYELAMRFGGERIVKLYQCGLQAFGLYKGEIDGTYSVDVKRALRACVSTQGCDPLPAEEECRKVTS